MTAMSWSAAALVQKLEFIEADVAAAEEPDDATLKAYLE